MAMQGTRNVSEETAGLKAVMASNSAKSAETDNGDGNPLPLLKRLCENKGCPLFTCGDRKDCKEGLKRGLNYYLNLPQ